ncbi:MAG: hypothetical protein ACOCV1_03450 [Bacillota bacterium]
MKDIINLELYSELSFSEKEEVLSFVSALVDKRLKFDKTYLSLKSLLVMLLALRNHKYKGATALEFEWIRKEFAYYNIKEKHIDERLDKLHSSNLIKREYFGKNFHQYRLNNEYKTFDNKYFNQRILENY